jgi:hypothetical protein
MPRQPPHRPQRQRKSNGQFVITPKMGPRRHGKCRPAPTCGKLPDGWHDRRRAKLRPPPILTSRRTQRRPSEDDANWAARRRSLPRVGPTQANMGRCLAIQPLATRPPGRPFHIPHRPLVAGLRPDRAAWRGSKLSPNRRCGCVQTAIPLRISLRGGDIETISH